MIEALHALLLIEALWPWQMAIAADWMRRSNNIGKHMREVILARAPSIAIGMGDSA